ncbi:MAG: hypothetical protein ACI9GM_001123 [Salibacteraceae bacterium]|jgi:hypothetical protein
MVEESIEYWDLTNISRFSSKLTLEYEPINRLRFSYGIGNLTKRYIMGLEHILSDLTGEIYEGLKIKNRVSYLPN